MVYILLLKHKIILILSCILILAGFFRLYNLDERYFFDWDQEDDATKVVNIIEQKRPLLIGGRVSTDNSIHLAPYHIYFELPFFILTNKDPIAGAYANAFIGILICLMYFLITQKLFNSDTALLSSFLVAISPKMTSWNVMYTPLFAIVVYYSAIQLLKQRYLFAIPLLAVSGLAMSMHLASTSLVIFAVLALLFAKTKLNFKQWLISIGAFVSFFLPLVIFDLRHDFININKIIRFEALGNAVTQQSRFDLLTSFLQSVTGEFSTITYLPILYVVSILVVIILAREVMVREEKIVKILLAVWFLIIFLLLALRGSSVPSYYYIPQVALVPIFLAAFLVRQRKLLIVSALSILFANQLFTLLTHKTYFSLADKKKVVQYLITQQDDPLFNVSYDFPAGFNVGYSYLFKYYGKTPQDKPEAHLYTITSTLTPLSDKDTNQIVLQVNNLILLRR